MTPEQETDIMRLRGAQVTPKQIARQLGLRPAEVKAFIRDHAEELVLQRANVSDAAPLHECLINEGAAHWLLDHKAKTTANGLAQIILSRQDGNRFLLASYLLDYWCLGLKNCIPPRRKGKGDYELFKSTCELQFDECFVTITPEQAQSIVYGAIDYARSLGFEPHPDFNAKAQVHLGLRPETLLPIEFGKDGQPFFVSGPYDDPSKVLETLEANVGPDKFKFLAGFDEVDLLDDDLF
ncbi:hypothetical protein [Leptolyngbya sp. PCC 6406]|uniref:hypothetical protein n=1 Tax=Leptolyngbya sp. PCC 6406 TaxID=1173264 RepID=UPI0002AC1D3B|nr:hypothetical protein [Leptolyngbya sp. PCC 6406]